jgi:repressor LexA
MKPLAPRQLAALRFVYAFWQRYGYAPTHREIADGLNIVSTNGVNDHLKRLEQRGLIRRSRMKSRALVVTDAGLQELILAAAQQPAAEAAQ